MNIKHKLGLCECKHCYHRATKYLRVFCFKFPVCEKHYKQLNVDDWVD